jgi:hypothetical protein
MPNKQMKWKDITPPVSVSHNNIGRCSAMNLNVVLSKESTRKKDFGTTVDKTMIPVYH